MVRSRFSRWSARTIIAAALCLAPMAASANCKLLQIAEFHPDMSTGVPIIDGAINGKPIKIAIDTGVGASLLFRSQMLRLNTRMTPLEGRLYSAGGGDTAAYQATIKALTIDKLVKNDMTLEVADDSDRPSDVAMLLGNDVLSRVDVEFDLANGAIRLFNSQGCAPGELVYWGKPYSLAQIQNADRDLPEVQSFATLNGQQVLAELDTGAAFSTIDAAVAASVGVARAASASPGPEDSWVGAFDSFALGDEKVGHVHLQVANLLGGSKESELNGRIAGQADRTPAMLIGDDFFRAHRIMIANREHVIVFSYNGGPVFTVAQAASSSAAARTQ